MAVVFGALLRGKRAQYQWGEENGGRGFQQALSQFKVKSFKLCNDFMPNQ